MGTKNSARIDHLIPKEYHQIVFKYLKANRYQNESIIYNESRCVFMHKYAFIYFPVSHDSIVEAWNWIESEIEKETIKEELTNKYGNAVSYFYNDVKIDNKGIFLAQGMFRKNKYFTLSELDELLADYNKKLKDSSS